MLGTKFKDPAATKPTFIDWSDYILSSHPALVDSDHITDSQWTVPAGLVNEASFNDTSTWITLSGGTLGAKYTLTNTIQLASGMIDARSFQLVIKAQ
jgi:hypothetical protein